MSDLERFEARPIAKPATQSWGPGYRCYTCNDTGTLLARRESSPHSQPFAFRCVCSRGENSQKRFPPWDAGHKGFVVIR